MNEVSANGLLMSNDFNDLDQSISTTGTRKHSRLFFFAIFFSLIIMIVSIIVVILVFTLKSTPEDNIDPELNDSSNLTFLFINDIHVDPKYQEYSTKSDNYCRIKNESVTVPHPYGQYNCDIPEKLFKSLMNFAAKQVPKIDFLLLGGDTVGHGLGLDKDGLRALIQSVVDVFEEKYPNVPKLISIGNNDFLKNYGTFSTDASDFENIYQIFARYMSDTQKETFLKGGYYYHDFTSQKLRLVLMNTVIYSVVRDDIEDSDPYGQFAWLDSIAADAEEKGLKVGIALHIPPGVSYWDYIQGWKDKYINKMYDVINKHDIEFSIAGHTHSDLLMPLFTDNNAKKLSAKRGVLSEDKMLLDYTLSAPSVTLAHANNPGFRVFHLSNGSIDDYDQYYADMMLNPQTEPEWKKEYSFKEIYGYNVTMENINKAVDWIRTTGEGMWRYREFSYTRAEDNLFFFYCILKAVTADEARKCVNGVSTVKLHPYGDRVE